MKVSSPHYVLFSEFSHMAGEGRWRFVLQAADGPDRLEAGDVEPGINGERLQLLTVIRGLEALDQPSRVTLITSSSYVREGIRHGLSEWRTNGWRWERFGQLVPVKNLDLWQRVDRAMRFHQVECRTRRYDSPHDRLEGPVAAHRKSRGVDGIPFLSPLRLQWFAEHVLAPAHRWAAMTLRRWRRSMERPLPVAGCQRLS
jgi:ribonuclease HI